ncbi:transmembrane protein 272-like [Rhynchophorus ferrugineus]|uniref:Uncharacterized protein n=1 Tax=Rhynchophorus ferrugineus TaxID=354439 RepID=A0A834IWV1_RHYFE|nr:hypothetical protein GWI33_003452 [Rhynchophorus ferrugineus]
MEPQSDQNDQPAVEQNEAKLQRIKTKCLPGVKITLIISILLSLVSFIIGIWGTHKCPVEDNIPFFLIVIGGIGLLSKVLTYVREKLVKLNDKTQYIMSVLYTVEIVFLLNGSFWVFKVYKPSFDPTDDDKYCSKTVYMFAFAYLFILYGMVIVVICTFLCFLGCILCVVATSDDTDVEAQNQSETQPIRQ